MSSAYEFGEEIQRLIVAFTIRDTVFTNMTDGLILPEYFDSDVHGFLVSLVIDHWEKYNTVPDTRIIVNKVRQARSAGRIDDDMVMDIKTELGKIYKTLLTNRDYMVDEVSKFAKYQAMTKAILEAAELLDNGGSMDEIVPKIQAASDIGAKDDSSEYDYLGLEAARKHEREEEAAGNIVKDGITTGHREFDKTLWNGGWGRGELSLYMGGPKSGKSVALAHHTRKAVEAGYSVLCVTLEVSAKILANRLDSGVSNVPMNHLMVQSQKVSESVQELFSKGGALKVHEFAAGTFSVPDLRRLVKRYQNKGLYFDLVVLDYADLMCHTGRIEKDTDRYKQIYIDLRSLAFSENFAMLTATQTNREGAKSSTAKDTDVADDFNKVRTVDLMITINADETEKSAKTCRLFYAASRNQAAVVIEVNRDLESMVHIQKILSIRGI